MEQSLNLINFNCLITCTQRRCGQYVIHKINLVRYRFSLDDSPPSPRKRCSNHVDKVTLVETILVPDSGCHCIPGCFHLGRLQGSEVDTDLDHHPKLRDRVRNTAPSRSMPKARKYWSSRQLKQILK